MPFFKRFLSSLISIIIFILIIWQTPPPLSWNQASTLQIILIFGAFYLLLFSLTNFVFQFWPRAFVVSIGITLLFILKALEVFNIISAFLTLLSTFFLIISFKKPPKKSQKIPSFSRLMKQ